MMFSPELVLRLPALGLDVMHVGMSPRLDVGGRAADVVPVLDYRISALDVLQRNLMADRNILLSLERDGAILVHDPAGQVLAAFHTLDDDHCDSVVWVVQYEMNHVNSWSAKNVNARGETADANGVA